MPEPKAALKLVNGRTPDTDSGGRPLKKPPAFRRTTPTKPDGLGEDGSALWDLVVTELPRVDRLKQLDGHALELACRCLDRWREAVTQRSMYGLTVSTPNGGTQIAPWVKIEEAAAKEFRGWCQEFGLSPRGELALASSEADDGGESNPFG